MRAALQGFLRRRKEKPEDLGVVELVSLGNLLCGFTPAEISRLDPVKLRLEEELGSKFLTVIIPCICTLITNFCDVCQHGCDVPEGDVPAVL